ncbi:cupin domain-containing protein [Sinomonas sp. B1-1]|uniref:cupin domain-containing protein n=1 Tax=Sinomonas sp. B1-1 TaxID=3141454 RepID=UPI003D29BC0B
MTAVAGLPWGLDDVVEPLANADRAALIESSQLFVGVKEFAPGEVFANHYHEGYDEFFAGLSGSLTLWTGRAQRVELTEGTSLLCRRGIHHYIVNETGEPARVLFAKVPLITDDTTWVDWSPQSLPSQG